MKSLIDEFDIGEGHVQTLLQDGLRNSDDGELFLEESQSEALIFDNGRLKTSSFNQNKGFGLRLVADSTAGYAHSGEFSKAALLRAVDAVKSVSAGYSGVYAEPPLKTSHQYYAPINPLDSPSFKEKLALLQKIDNYIRSKNENVRQVSVSLSGTIQRVEIMRKDGQLLHDIRPLVRLSISVVAGKGTRLENGYYSCGGRQNFETYINEKNWLHVADEALRMALVNLQAEEAPAGTFDVVLANGWPGVMLHEAVGHGLEGDANRKKLSAFSELMGQQIAAKGVTVVDDGTVLNHGGSLNIDDEGTPSQHNILIEDGKLVGFMQDRQNARLMNMKPTGNGRRQSYAFAPMPRMTNTYMLGGQYNADEIISSLKNGIYAASFGGGQVDTTSGKFVFECTEAYRVENGKITTPIKGATLIGNGPDAMKRITMIGNDAKLGEGVGMCGKNGQSLPVGIGQPHLRVNAMTLGGTSIR